MAWQSSTIDPNTTSPAADISKIKNDLAVLRGVLNGTADTDVPTKFQPLDPRVQSVTAAAAVTPTTTNDMVDITAQDQALTLNNPTGTPANGQGMVIRIKDNGTARAITWGSGYRALGAALPTTTTAGKTMYVPVVYNAGASKWDVLPATVET